MRRLLYSCSAFLFFSFSISSAIATTHPLEVLWLDTHSPVAIEYIEVQSDLILESGVPYLLRVQGNFSVQPVQHWTSQSPCGTPKLIPQYPSPNTTNGRVGADAAFTFGTVWHYSPGCNNLSLPSGGRTLPVSLDGGNSIMYLSPENNTYNANHVYTYNVEGEGKPLKVRFFDSYHQMDNYGQLKIEIYPVSATCQLYGVHDHGVNHSQLFTVNPYRTHLTSV